MKRPPLSVNSPAMPKENSKKKRATNKKPGKASAKRYKGKPDFSKKVDVPGSPLIIPRNEHCISRKDIDHDALKVMYRLINHGYKGFLVGGGVRDLLLGRKPKDFDISTDATTEKVRSLFRNSRTIGRRFRINHVYFRGRKIMEVSTFRASDGTVVEGDQSLIKSDNVYGDAQTDAFRRDLTINGLFYDLGSFSVIDYVGGIRDLNDGIVRIIGDPEKRLREDPIRMIRVVRHAARIGFTIEKETYDAICRLQELILLSPRARIYDELMKDLLSGSALESFRLLDKTKLLSYLFPVLGEVLEEDKKDVWVRLQATLEGIDDYARAEKQLPPSVIFLSLVIGSLSQEQLVKKRGEIDPDIFSALWQVSPIVSLNLKGGDEEEEVEDDYHVDRTESGGISRRALISRLRKLITDLFKPVGVSQRERERMEQLLLLRNEMVSPDTQNINVRSITLNPYLDHALSLLNLTAHDAQSKKNLEYWEKQAENESELPRPEKRKRRRRRKPRRDNN